MEWKTSGIRRKLVSTRGKVFKAFRLISGLGKEESGISSPTSRFTAVPYESVNPLAGYSLEVELRQAQALTHWRRWENRPK